MKQIFLILIFSTVAFFATGQDALVEDVATTDSTTLPTTDNVDQLIGDINTWMEGCGADLKTLIANGKVAIPELVATLTGGPKPNTVEGVQYWTDTIDWLWAAGRSLVTTISVFFLSLFKSKEETAENASKIQKWFDGIKTRYLIAFTAPVVTLIGLVAFKGDGWTWLEAAGWVLGTGAGSMFIAQLLEWLNIRGLKLTARKAPATA